MVAFNKFNAFVEDVYEGKHNLGADVLKLLLSNTAPLATNSVLANLTEIAAGNGYTAGGLTVVVTASSQTGGLYKLVANDLTLTASGGPIAQFRYASLYNSTPVGGPLIGWWDRITPVDLGDGESITFDLSQANGVLQHS